MCHVRTLDTPYTRTAKGRLGKSTSGVNKSARLVSPSEEDEGEPTVRVFINDTEVGDHPSGAISFHQPLISPLRVVQHLITPGGTLVAPQEVLMKTNLTQNGGRTYFLLRLLLSPSIPLRSPCSLSIAAPFLPCESIWQRYFYIFRRAIEIRRRYELKQRFLSIEES